VKQSLREKILQSSIPATPKIVPLKVDLDSPIFYQQLAANALAAVAIARSLGEVYEDTARPDADADR